MKHPARLILMIALVAVMLRALIPAGYMPETGSGKTFQITICSMEGPKMITVDEKSQPVSGDHHHAKETCPFSILNHSPFNAQIASIVFDTPARTAALQQIIAHDQFVRSHIFNPIAQPRAPPVTA
jgi:hypothetical protein